MIGFVIAGIIIGILARLLLPGRQHLGWLGTILAGLAGSVVGGVVANMLGTGDIWELNVLGFVVAVVAAIVFIAIAEAVFSSGRGSRRIL